MDKRNFFRKKLVRNSEDRSPDERSDSEDSQQQDRNDLADLFSEEPRDGQQLEKLQGDIRMKIQEMARYLCENNHIGLQWVPLLSNFAIKAVSETQIESLSSHAPLDIAHYVKIKKIATSEPGVTRAFRGYATQKNVSNKHMTTTFNDGRVMIIAKSIQLTEFAAEPIKFEEIITKEKQILKRILDKVLRFSPDVVLVENTVNIYALEYLQSKGITVISKLKPKVVESIKRIAHIRKKVDKLWRVEMFKQEQIIGTVKRLYFREFIGSTRTTLMFVEDDQSPIISILLADPDKDKLQCLKKIMRRLLRATRSLYLQSFLLDLEMTKLNRQKVAASGIFDGFSDKKYNSIEAYLLKKSIRWSKVCYVHTRFSGWNQLRNVSLESYFKNIPYAVSWKPKDQQLELCCEPEYKEQKFYDKNDMALGIYLLLEAANFDKQCQQCGRPKYNHVATYLVSRTIVKMMIENKFRVTQHTSPPSIRTIDPPSPPMQALSPSPLNALAIGLNIGNGNNPNSDIDDSLQSEGNMIMTRQKLYLHLKQKMKSTVNHQDFCSYLECEDCHMRLAEPTQLKRSYLECSILHFLFKMVQSHESYESKYNSTSLSMYNSPVASSTNLTPALSTLSQEPESATHRKKSGCHHTKRVTRVFRCEETFIKFSLSSIDIYSYDAINYQNPHAKYYTEKLESTFFQSLISRQIMPLKQGCDQLLDYLNLVCNSHALMQVNPRRTLSSKWHTAVESIYKLKEIVQRLCQRMEGIEEGLDSPNHRSNSSSSSSKESIHGDFSRIFRESHESYFMLAGIVKSIEEIDVILKKQKKEKNEDELSQVTIPLQSSPSNDKSIDFPDMDLQSQYSGATSTYNSNIDLNKKQELWEESMTQLLGRYQELRWTQDDNMLLNYAPVFRDDPITFIGFALNSKTFLSQNHSNQTEFKVRVELTNVCGRLQTSQLNAMITEVRENLKIELKRKDYKDQVYEVTIFNHHQFERIRNKEGISYDTFVKSILGCACWDNSGGKSGSKFAKSYNELIVMKIVNDKEFIEFRKFVSSYIEYVEAAKAQKNDSLLAKIFGIYEVNINGRISNCIVMQNIFFGIDMKNVRVYDLKGSQTNRFAVPKDPKSSFTGLDTNYKVDRNGEPISLETSLFERTLRSLEDDCRFLSDQMVIDYSLLLIVNQDKSLVRMAIIDFMRPYHLGQKIQNLYKQIKSGTVPTVVPPKFYSERFVNAMRRYFVKVE